MSENPDPAPPQDDEKNDPRLPEPKLPQGKDVRNDPVPED